MPDNQSAASSAHTTEYPMKYHSDIHHRRSIRLKQYDYSSDGAYFVTICTYNKNLYFENTELAKIAQKV
jgi:hypothetical protein